MLGDIENNHTECGYVNLNGIVDGNIHTSDAQLHWSVGFRYPVVGASMAIIQTFARQGKKIFLPKPTNVRCVFLLIKYEQELRVWVRQILLRSHKHL